MTQPVDFSALPESGAPMTVAVPGTMTNKGVTRDATAKLDVKRAGERGDRRGSVTWTDYVATPPDFAGFVKVRPTGTIEFLVNLTKN